MSTNMIANVNLFSMSGHIAVGRAQGNMNTAINQLSSGLRINSFMDDPSRMAISERMRGFILGLQTATKNAQDGISYLQTAEGATNEISTMLQRMRELAVQGANGVYSANDRLEIQKEMDQLKAEIDRISESTQFNTKKLLNGDSTGAWNSGTSKISAVLNGTVADGNYDINVSVEPGQNQVQTTQILTIRDGKLGAELKGSTTSNIGTVSKPDNIASSSEGGDYTLTVSNPALERDTMEQVSKYIGTNSNMSFRTVTAVTSNESGYFQVEFINSSDNATSGATYKVKFISAETGEEGQWQEFSTISGALTGSYNSNGFNIDFNIPMENGSNKVQKGDKFLFTVSDTKDTAPNTNLLASGGGSLQISQGNIKGPVVNYTQPNSLTKADNKDGVEDFNNVTIHTVTLDPKTGDIRKGSITVGFQENSNNINSNGATKSGVATIEVRKGGQPATPTTKLADLDNFVDENGINLFASTQELKIYGNNTFTTIYLEGDDTIEDFVNKLTKAITKDLNMGSGDVAVDKELVKYNTKAGDGFEAVPGTMIIQSALTGVEGKLSFIGSQKMMDALGLQEVQEAAQNIQTITAKDNITGVVIGERITSNSRVTDVIPGLDIMVDTRTGVDAYWDKGTGKIRFKESNRLENKNLTLHIVDARTELQIGTERRDQINVSIPEINTKSLGIGNTNINTQAAAQKAITEVDNALTKVVSARADMGAHINRLESTMRNLAESEENATSSESRIRDTDIAKATTDLTVAQVAYQANITILAQANQLPRMALSLLEG